MTSIVDIPTLDNLPSPPKGKKGWPWDTIVPKVRSNFSKSSHFPRITVVTPSFNQGSFILGKTNPGSKVKIDNKDVLVTKDGYFAFGIGRDRKNDITIQITKDQKLDVIVKKIFKRLRKISEFKRKNYQKVRGDIFS